MPEEETTNVATEEEQTENNGQQTNEDLGQQIRSRLRGEEPPSTEETPETETPSADSPEETPSEPEFDQDLLQFAHDEFGLTTQQARSFGSPEKLERALLSMARREIQMGRQQDVPEPEDPFDVSVRLPDDDSQDEDVNKRLLNEVNNALKKLSSASKSETEKLKKTVDGLQRSLQQSQQALFVNRFDALVEKLGSAYKDVLGEGSSLELDPNSKAAQNRSRLIEEIEDQVQVAQMRGRPIPSEKTLVTRALNNLFGDRTAKKARDDVEAEVRERNKAKSRRPSSRSDDKPQLDDRTQRLKAVRDKIDEIRSREGV